MKKIYCFLLSLITFSLYPAIQQEEVKAFRLRDKAENLIKEYVKSNSIENIINTINYLRNYNVLYAESPTTAHYPSTLTQADVKLISDLDKFSHELPSLSDEEKHQKSLFYEDTLKSLIHTNLTVAALLDTLPSIDTFIKQANNQDKIYFNDFINSEAHIGTVADPFALLESSTQLADTPFLTVCKVILNNLLNSHPLMPVIETLNPINTPGLSPIAKKYEDFFVVHKDNKFSLTDQGHAYFNYLKKYIKNNSQLSQAPSSPQPKRPLKS